MKLSQLNALVLGLILFPSFAYGQIVNSAPAIDLVQDIANISITIEKSMPNRIDTNLSQPSKKFSAIDLVQSIHSEITSNTNYKVSENIPKVDIELQKAFPSYNSLDSGDDLELLEFDETDEPFSDEFPEYPPIEDPLEGYNRFMQGINDGIYDYMIEPVAIVYRGIVPEIVRLGIRNVFANAASPMHFVSSLIQGDVDKAVRVIGRLVLNSTLGLGGFFDVAGDYYKVEPVNEDMEQAIGSYGVGSGPYLVLPFFGPSSPRNLVGMVFDGFLNPTYWFSPSFIIGAGITAEERVNSTSFIVDDFKELKENAVDPYISLRDFNHQFREKLIRK